MEPLRDGQQLPGHGQAQRLPAVLGLDEHEQLAEGLGDVGPVDLVDDEHVVPSRVGGGAPAEPGEDALGGREPALGRGAQPDDDVLIDGRLVELHHLHPRVIRLAHEGVGQALGREGLPRARSALEDEVLLAAQQPEHLLQVLGADEHLRQEALPRVDVGEVGPISILGTRSRVGGRGRGRVVPVPEQRLELGRVVARVLRDSLQAHCAHTPVERPGTDMRPLDIAYAAVGGPGFVVTELRADDAAPDDLGRTAPGVNDVAGTHRAGEVPDHARRACRPASPVPVSDLQRLDDRLVIRVAGGVADPVPVERHDPGRSKLLPLPGALTRDVEPVAALPLLGRLNILIRRRHRLTHDSSSSPVPAALRARPEGIVVPAHPIATSRVHAPPGLDIDAVGDIPRGRGHFRPAGGIRRRRGPDSCPPARSLSPAGRKCTPTRRMSPSRSAAQASCRSSADPRRPVPSQHRACAEQCQVSTRGPYPTPCLIPVWYHLLLWRHGDDIALEQRG